MITDNVVLHNRFSPWDFPARTKTKRARKVKKEKKSIKGLALALKPVSERESE